MTKPIVKSSPIKQIFQMEKCKTLSEKCRKMAFTQKSGLPASAQRLLIIMLDIGDRCFQTHPLKKYYSFHRSLSATEKNKQIMKRTASLREQIEAAICVSVRRCSLSYKNSHNMYRRKLKRFGQIRQSTFLALKQVMCTNAATSHR